MRFVFRFLLRVVFVIAWLVLLTYLPTSIYNFKGSTHFSGDSLYNPYAKCDFTQTQIANFHAHTQSWFGLTNGDVSSDSLYATYKQAGYDIIGISDYMSINQRLKKESGYIPIYEHGVNVKKTHQLVIGAERVSWMDQIPFQSRHQKQSVINDVHGGGSWVVLAHPGWGNGYGDEELKSLSGFDGMEVFNHGGRHDRKWDVVLSSGNPVFGIGTDDFHALKPQDVARSLTIVYAPTTEKNMVLQALKKGQHVSVNLPYAKHFTIGDKADLIRQLPEINHFNVHHDSIKLDFNQEAKSIVFIRQHGDTAQLISNAASASYHMNLHDEYIRVSVVFENGTEYLFNPVYRFDPSQPPGHVAEVNQSATLLLRLIIIFALLTPLHMFFYRSRPRNGQKIPTPRYFPA